MNLERVQKYYELIDRELGLESNDDDLFGFESEEEDLFGFESEEDLFCFESDEDLFEYGFDYGAEGLKDVGKKVWGGVKKVGSMIKNAFKKIYQFIINMIKRIKNAVFGLFRKSNTTSSSEPDTPKATSIPETPKASEPVTPTEPVTPKFVIPALTMPIEFKNYINASTKKQFKQNIRTFTDIARHELVGKTISDFIKGTGISDDRRIREIYRRLLKSAQTVNVFAKAYSTGMRSDQRSRFSKIRDLIDNKLSNPMTGMEFSVIIYEMHTVCVEMHAVVDSILPDFKLPDGYNTDIYVFRSEKDLTLFNKYMMAFIKDVAYILRMLDTLAKHIKSWQKEVFSNKNDSHANVQETMVMQIINQNIKNMTNIDTRILKYSTALSDAISALTQLSKASHNAKKSKTIYKNF